ncbi:MAG: pyridoxal phosphate-dependent aminotransferase [Bacteriovoracaceae bacterium]|nr:pyridoxal phosphate-dependent aminotransferase [Bacteriovoracaceae bacterium]
MTINSFNPFIPTEISRLRTLAATANSETINLTVGHPLDHFPEELVPYLSMLHKSPLSYSSNQGDLNLRKLIAEKYDFLPDEVAITNGAQGGLMNALMALVEAGKTKVAIPNPGFLAYPTMVKMLGGIVCEYEYEVSPLKHFHLSVDGFVNQIPNDCQVIIMNTPSNPCGHEFTIEELKAIAAWAQKNKKFLILDEVYGELNYVENYCPALYANPYVASISSLSKSHALAGARLGWMISKNKEWLQRSIVVNQYFNTCASSLAQQLGIYLFDAEDGKLYKKILNRYREVYQKNLSAFFSNYPEINPPKSAFYGFVPIPKEFKSSEEYVQHLLRKKNILCVPGNYFGTKGEGHIRVALATKQKLLTKI